jgi:NTE family protein
VLARLFGDMSPEDWKKLEGYLEPFNLPSGYYLFRQGDLGDAMYIVVSGRLQVRVESDRQVNVVNEIGRGETVGEMAIITGENRSASILAIRDCHLYRISKESFYRFFTAFPAIGLNLSRLLIERLRQKVSPRNLRGISNVAIVPLNRGIDMERFVESLKQTFTGKGKTVKVLDSAYVDDMLGAGAAQVSLLEEEANNRVTAWLESVEQQNNYVFYLPDEAADEWTRRCIRQADEILLVADAMASPGLTRLETTLLSGEQRLTTARQTLVLMHPAGLEFISGTSKWLKNRNVGYFMHIRADKSAHDFGRLERYLTDEMIGLVLAGGGAKGFAHIGVWRALQEMNIPVDMIGGTSMGAMMGGIMAFDWDYQKIYDTCREIAYSPLKSDFSILPIVSLFKGKVLDRVLQRHYLDHEIEDCPFSFYCVSSNMTLAKPQIHTRGNMFHAIRASGAIPAVVPPVVDGNSLLIDGGIFNNFPTDVMVGNGARFIIGVDFLVDQSRGVTYNQVPSNWRVLMRRWLGGNDRHRYPTMLGTIIESTTLYSAYTQKQNSDKTDIYINPDVSNFSMLEWKAYDKIVQKGYEEAKRILQEAGDNLPNM